jgi:hypothetical protein
MSVDGEIVHARVAGATAPTRHSGRMQPHAPSDQRLDHADRCVSGSQELDQGGRASGCHAPIQGRRRGQPFERPAFDRDARPGRGDRRAGHQGRIPQVGSSARLTPAPSIRSPGPIGRDRDDPARTRGTDRRRHASSLVHAMA